MKAGEAGVGGRRGGLAWGASAGPLWDGQCGMRLRGHRPPPAGRQVAPWSRQAHCSGLRLQRPGSHGLRSVSWLQFLRVAGTAHVNKLLFSVRSALARHLGGQGGVSAPCTFHARAVAGSRRVPRSDLMMSHSGHGSRRAQKARAEGRSRQMTALTAPGAVYTLGVETWKVILKLRTLLHYPTR